MYLEEISVGLSAEITRTVTQANIQAFADLSGDTNPVHVDPAFAATTRFKGPIAHGMLCGALISAVLGTRLPGIGAVYMNQTMKFCAPVHPGDVTRAVVTVTQVTERGRSNGEVVCSTQVFVGDVMVVDGEATLMVGKRPQV